MQQVVVSVGWCVEQMGQPNFLWNEPFSIEKEWLQLTEQSLPETTKLPRNL